MSAPLADIVFDCLDRGEVKNSYGRQFADLHEVGRPGGMADLHIAGFPLLDKIEKGKRYRITVEELIISDNPSRS